MGWGNQIVKVANMYGASCDISCTFVGLSSLLRIRETNLAKRSHYIHYAPIAKYEHVPGSNTSITCAFQQLMHKRVADSFPGGNRAGPTHIHKLSQGVALTRNTFS